MIITTIMASLFGAAAIKQFDLYLKRRGQRLPKRLRDTR